MVEMERKKRRQNRKMLLRANLLFVVVFFLFSILVLRLGYVQMVQGKSYINEIERTDDNIVYHPVPRGEIFDRNGNLLVNNKPLKAITYTPPKNPQPKDLLNLAEKLSSYIQMNEDNIQKVPDWVKKEIWIIQNNDGKDKITKEEEELLRNKELSDRDLYKLILERITEEDIAPINGNIAAIYQQMRSAVAFTPTIIKSEGVTEEEFASVSENLENLPGVSTSTDWQRDYPYGQVFRSVLGRTKEGLPTEKLDYFSTKDYALNDRYGASYLEELYEDILSGVKIQEKVITDNRGNFVSSELISEGEPGRDLILTIDIEFQERVEQIIEEELLRAIKHPRTDTLDRMFVVAMDPKTGEILALAGKRYNRETQSFEEFSHGTFTQAFEAGSTVKGATVLTGYQTGVLKPGDQKEDKPMDIPGLKEPKSSYGGNALGVMDDLKAIERSSNVYMWLIALDIMDGYFVPGSRFSLNPEKIETIRYYFGQFGLGTKTGIGFKEEIEGLKANKDPGEQAAFLDIAIGQFDTYTPLQLASYVATIANDGNRMKPMLVKEIRATDLDEDGESPVIQEFHPTLLNRLDMKQEWIERVQQGFWQVTHGSQGTARRYFASLPVAGKTGTAESRYVDDDRFKRGVDTSHSLFVGYAPFENPEVAISVTVPHAFYGSQPYGYTIGAHVAQRVFRAYFE